MLSPHQARGLIRTHSLTDDNCRRLHLKEAHFLFRHALAARNIRRENTLRLRRAGNDILDRVLPTRPLSNKFYMNEDSVQLHVYALLYRERPGRRSQAVPPDYSHIQIEL